jgi:hypothetical protein
LLSPRKLIYDVISLEWDCLSGKEKFTGNGFVGTESLLTMSTRTPSPVNFFAGPSYSPSDESIVSSWAEFIEDFSSRSLSCSEDKLSAMSAVAIEYHRISGWTYAAGLWLETILIDLFWQLDDKFEWLRSWQSRSWPKMQRPLTYRAPSWSWTAVDGPVKPGYKQDFKPGTEVAEVVEVIREYHHGAPFGRLLGCTLIVIAPLLLCATQELRRYVGKDVELTFDFGPTEAPEDDKDECGLLWLISTPLDASANDDGVKGYEGLAAGLIVMPADRKEDSWRRVGIFHSMPLKPFEGRHKQKLQLV